MKRSLWPARDSVKDYFSLPKEIFSLGLSAAEIAIYAYLLFCEDRQTFQCWPSYRKIGDAVGLSPNTIRKHIRLLEERGLIVTEPTMVTTKDGYKRNGNLLFCEDRQTFQCWPSYRKIGEAVGLSPNTIRKHIRALEEHELLITEPTLVTTKDGKARNGNLRFTIRPIQAALQQDYDRQMQKLDEDMAKRKYADFIENTD